MQKLLILTSSKDTLSWKSLDKKLAAIKVALNSGKNASWLVEIEYKSATPVINNKKRIDHKWLADFILPASAKGNVWVPFHFSRKQYVAWDIKQSLRGSNPDTDDGLGDMWFWADEDTKRKGYDQFIEDVLHEGAHEYFAVTGLPDITHEWHEEHGTIVGLFATFDWALYLTKKEKQTRLNTFLKYIPIYQNKLKNALMGQISALTANLAKKPPTRLLHPVEKYRDLISQEYGRANSDFYPLTGHHTGTDYACPVGTPVRAPWVGEVTVSGKSAALGNFCHYKYTFDGVAYVERFMHLSDIPVLGKYKLGEVVELSGKTGKITGPHFHHDIWYNEVRLDLLTAKNWMNLTIDPQKHYA